MRNWRDLNLLFRRETQEITSKSQITIQVVALNTEIVFEV
jgi:hypothetical protein